ncbi:MAG: glycerol-3-phosphate cytidylyltransferase [Bacteroidetes bacterium GWE2_29_8]|nr:MAG: glycerol-3-phosphate cytidylyltransferase [Bacteroidetes bacterium GWE2_29_8]OFY18753.1 MAG: glycerol-3-phosphate cytidylyltransferase [Bacteroidetes bacterium GWF2_29_10]
MEFLNENLAKWKNNKETIVFTNGCFDIIHLGHIKYLAQAASLGSKLIIGLNSDASVKRLKGNDRPINNQYARSFVLAALFMVDAVIIFEEDTPEILIKNISPDILVKGGDYEEKNIVGAEFVKNNGGEIQIISFIEGYSTTKIINKKNK